MPHILFDHVSKTFGGTSVIEDFNAEIEDKEFLVLLGPSGCGKSTMLRMIAGLSEVSGGDIFFDGVRVNDLEPKERDVAFVFQSYALYPNMTVRDNIAFPLLMHEFRWWHHLPGIATIMRKVIVGHPELREKVESVARTLELTDYLDRRPKNLSGGQRQRVALARSLVRDPELYLLDEPLSNLDAKLRGQMRTEITNLFQRVQKTFVYVTHDQVEAMTMATRIIVLKSGVIQQIGTPEEIYERPANTFVARFIGSPGMNLVPMASDAGRLTVSGVEIDGQPEPGAAFVGIRPEHMLIGPAGHFPLAAKVTSVEQLGGETLLGVELDGIASVAGSGDPETDGAASTFVRLPADRSWTVGDACTIDLPAERMRFFDADGAAAGELHDITEVAR